MSIFFYVIMKNIDKDSGDAIDTIFFYKMFV